MHSKAYQYIIGVSWLLLGVSLIPISQVKKSDLITSEAGVVQHAELTFTLVTNVGSFNLDLHIMHSIIDLCAGEIYGIVKKLYQVCVFLNGNFKPV